MRFILYVTVLVALLPLIFTRPFFGLCIYYAVSLLQPKILCWEPEFQDALLVGVPLVIGTAAFGVRRLQSTPERDGATGQLKGIRTEWVKNAIVQPCYAVLALGLLIAYVTVTRLMVPYPLENNSYQFRSLCKIVMVAALTTGLVAGPRQYRVLFLVVALSTAFWAIKGGMKVMMYGPHQVYGKTYDNNLFALTSVMALPMVFYFGLTVKHAKWRAALLVCSALMCLGIIGSRSRAGFMAFVVVLLCMAWSSRYRIRALLAVSLVAALTALMSGPEILDRAHSIFTYSEDLSARSRFSTWDMAWQIFLRNPVIGVGFNNFEYAKDVLYGGKKAAHNIFLQNLSELGAVGTPIWLAVVFGSMFGLYRLMRRARSLPADMRWVYYCSRGLLLGMLGFCIHGFFHNEEYIEQMFVMVALGATLKIVADRQWYEMKLAAELASLSPSVETGKSELPPGIGETPPGLSDRPRTLSELIRRGGRLRPG